MDDLTRERYTSPWWRTPDTPTTGDSERSCTQRRLVLDAEYSAHERGREDGAA